MKLTRRVAFSSGHRYWLANLSPEENKALFGRWASPYNHGHNYVLEVTVAGKIQGKSGMVVNIKDIDQVLQELVVARFDQKSLNDEVPEFENKSTSTESIATLVRDAIKPHLPDMTKLTNVRLYENPLLFVDVGENDTVLLTRVYEFSASHRLDVPDLSNEENIDLFGKCNNLAGHGHNYILEVTVSGKADSRTGMVADLEAIDKVVEKEVVDRYDHKHLNVDIPEFQGLNPTTEVLTKMIWDRLVGKLPATLHKVLVRETARNIFEYAGEDN